MGAGLSGGWTAAAPQVHASTHLPAPTSQHPLALAKDGKPSLGFPCLPALACSVAELLHGWHMWDDVDAVACLAQGACGLLINTVKLGQENGRFK